MAMTSVFRYTCDLDSEHMTETFDGSLPTGWVQLTTSGQTLTFDGMDCAQIWYDANRSDQAE